MRAATRGFLAAAATLAVLGASACSGVPRNGPVQSAAEGGEAPVVGGSEIRVQFSGPRSGQSPVEVVRGFLVANAAPPADLDLAGAFLDERVRLRWQPRGVRVVDGESLEIVLSGASDGAAQVLLRADQVGRLDDAGAYVDESQQLFAVFTLSRGQRGWRIVDPPDVTVLTVEDFDRVYRAVDVYFPTADGGRLVADRRYVAATRSELPQAAVAALQSGPGPWLAPAVRPDPLPVLSGVTTSDGVATVRLTSAAAGLTTEQRELLAAQVTLSLGGIGLAGVRVVLDGDPIVPEAPEVMTPADWGELAGQAEGPGTYVLAGSVLSGVSVERGRPVDLTGARAAWALPEAMRVRAAAVSPGERLAAVVAAEGPTAALYAVTRRGDVTRLWGAATIASPTWGGSDDTVLAVRDSSDLVRAVVAGGRPAVAVVRLEGAGLPLPLPLRAVRVAPDGVRVALLAGADGAEQLHLGRLAERDGLPVLEGVVRLRPGLSGVTSVAWAGPASLALATRAEGGPVLLGVDGSGLRPMGDAGLPGPVTVVAAADRAPTLVASGGDVFVSRDEVWVRLPGVWGEGDRVPIYPG